MVALSGPSTHLLDGRRHLTKVLQQSPFQEEQRWNAVYHLVLATGMRPGELRALKWKDLNAVFTGVGGVHLSLSTWQNRHRKLCAAIKACMPEGETFPRPTLHELRHTAATLMLANNINVKIVSDILDHRKIETTLNIYQHVSADLQRAASDRLDAFLNATTADPEQAENS